MSEAEAVTNAEEGAEQKVEEVKKEEVAPEPIPEPQQKVLSKDMCADGLSSIELIEDGSTWAYCNLNLENKGIDLLGDTLSSYDYLRVVNLNQNNLKNIDKIRSLKYLQKIEAKNNKI